MNQDERWDAMYMQIIGYIALYKHRPSKYNPAERRMVNWLKHNKKMMQQDNMDESRKERFRHLLSLCEKYQRINQNAYANPDMATDNLELTLDFDN